MRKTTIFLAIFLLILRLFYCYLNVNMFSFLNKENSRWQGKVFVKWFLFNRENALEEWQEKIFRGKVLYVVVPQKDKGYLLAKSDKSASGIFYKLSYDPRKCPMISWKWKVVAFPDKETYVKTSKAWIEGDDYAARVYVIFPAFYFMNTKCLEYVWDESLPEGKIITSPFFKNIKLIVAESGSANLGKWVFEERDIVEDFARAFGRPLNLKVSAIAIMTNADNTASFAQAEYGDIKVGYEKDEKK